MATTASSDDVGNGVLRPPEERDAGERDRHRDRDRDQDGGQLQLRAAEQGGTKPVDGRHHRIHRVSDPPLLGNDARWVGDWCAKEPELDEQRYRELTAKDPQLESRPTFLFFKGAASGLFDAGSEQLRGGGVDDERALLIGIKCERGSHKFFKRYGERFEDSEGKQVFLEFADEERAHLDLLIREYRSLRQRQGRRRMRRGGALEAASAKSAKAEKAAKSAKSARR